MARPGSGRANTHTRSLARRVDATRDLWDPRISGRGFNVFKALRRTFRAIVRRRVERGQGLAGFGARANATLLPRHIDAARYCRDPRNSGRGFNLIKALRRIFRAIVRRRVERGHGPTGSGRAKTPACSRAASTPPEIFGTVAIPGADSIFSRRCDGFSGGCNCQLCHARGGGHPGPRSDEGVISRKRDNLSERRPWIPAFAGMTRSNVLPASGLRRWASGRWRAARENLPNNRAHALPAHGENGAAILATETPRRSIPMTNWSRKNLARRARPLADCRGQAKRLRKLGQRVLSLGKNKDRTRAPIWQDIVAFSGVRLGGETLAPSTADSLHRLHGHVPCRLARTSDRRNPSPKWLFRQSD